MSADEVPESSVLATVRSRYRETSRAAKALHREVEALRESNELLRSAAIKGWASELGVADPRHREAVVKLHGDGPASPDAVAETVREHGALFGVAAAKDDQGADDE